ncbi:MAG: alpha/beta fold hydrolase [Deltaproteobacteria bacterium]|nr:alpha/beta fold hydrolase [Deltaproteobacteria bacterium]
MQYEREGFVDAADGTRLFYEELGGGAPPVVLVDGIGCDGFAWRYLAPRLAEHHRVLHGHFRGHGRSGPPLDRDRLSIEDLARDLRKVCDERDVARPVIAAHSMGVQVALEYYRQNPEGVAALVLMCGTFGRITSTFHGTDLLDQVLPGLIRGSRMFPGIARAVWGRVPAAMAPRGRLSTLLGARRTDGPRCVSAHAEGCRAARRTGFPPGDRRPYIGRGGRARHVHADGAGRRNGRGDPERRTRGNRRGKPCGSGRATGSHR